MKVQSLIRHSDLLEESIEILHDIEFDIRAVTLGLNIGRVPGNTVEKFAENLKNYITIYAKILSKAVGIVQKRYNVKIANRRIAVTPVGTVAARFLDINKNDFVKIAKAMDEGIKNTGVDIIGGFSVLAHKGLTEIEKQLIESLPQVLSKTNAVCASVNVASTKTGINMETIRKCANIILKIAEATKDQNSFGCAKVVVFANMPEDNPFMAGAIHGLGEPDASINVGVSGPGVIRQFLEHLKQAKEWNKEQSFEKLERAIKRGVAKITAVGDLIGKEVVEEMNHILQENLESFVQKDQKQWLNNWIKVEISPGIVDLSLAPTIKERDSVAEIIRELGVPIVGGPGTTVALAMLIDAVKKGGVISAAFPGGLSGTFIPVSEDACMAQMAEEGYLTLEKLEAITAVCSVGMDMFAIPGDVSEDILAALIADEMAIGVINNKATAVRVIPVKKPVYKIEKDNGEYKPTLKVVFWVKPEWMVDESGNMVNMVDENGNIIEGKQPEDFKEEEFRNSVRNLKSKLIKLNNQTLKFAYYSEKKLKENLWGEAPIMNINYGKDSIDFVNHRGRISAPIRSLTN